MEIILTTLKRRIRPALVPPQPTLEPVASQLPSSFVRLIWNRQSLNSTVWEPLAAVEKYHIILMKFVVWFGLVMWTNRRACWCYKRSHWPMTGIRWNMYSHLVFYYIFPPEFEISHFLGWIKSPRLRLGDFIQPKKCEISNSGGNIFCKMKQDALFPIKRLTTNASTVK